MTNLRFQCQYAKAMGLEVLAIDSSKEKRDLCVNELAVASFIDFAATKDLVADVKAAAGGLGPHAAIIVAGRLPTPSVIQKKHHLLTYPIDNEKCFAQATEYVRPRGTVVCVSLPRGARASVDVFSMVTKMINICGSYVGSRADTQEALDFFKRGKVGVPFQIRELKDLPQVYKDLEEMKIVGRVVLKIPD